MKKIFGTLLLIIALVFIWYSFFTNIRTTYCCSCEVDGWRFGIAISTLYERDHILCSCAANMGCTPAYRLIPLDFLLISIIVGAAGLFLLVKNTYGREKKILLKKELSDIVKKTICEDVSTKERYMKRILENAFSREENPESHFCVYFLPYNSMAKKFFIVHHKKSGLWIAPGGHLDKGESLHQTLNREIEEELGVKNFFLHPVDPFLLTITPIERATSPCKFHFDIWYLMPTDGTNFHVDPSEFFETRWMTFEETKGLVTNKQNTRAFELIQQQ